MGNYRPGSDIDIAVKGKNISFDTTLSLLRKLETLDLPYKIDIVHFDKISDPDVISHIERKDKLLFKRSGTIK